MLNQIVLFISKELVIGHIQEGVKVFAHEPGQDWQHSLANVAVPPGKYAYIPLELQVVQ